MAEERAFADQAGDWLEKIYEAACGKPKLGRPALMLPEKSLLRATDGKFESLVFVELRLVLDLIREGLLPPSSSSRP